MKINRNLAAVLLAVCSALLTASTFAAADATIVPATIVRIGDQATVHGDLAVFPFAG